MQFKIQFHYNNTEWLYAPGFVYHQYDDGVTRELSLIFPYRAAWESDERFPLVVYIPGAAWHRQELCNDVPKYTRLAERGNVFAIVQVRESDIAPFPAQIEDIHRAVVWLIEHAEQFHIDTSQIILAGNSSGGHLALLTAFTKAHGKYIPEGLLDYTIAGVIGQAASSDLKLCQSNPWPAEWGKRPTTCLMGADTDEECLEKADVAVCKNYVASDVALPSVLLLHFADDPIVNSQMSRDLYEILTQTNHSAAYYELAGNAHGGNGMWTHEIVNIMERFISKTKDPVPSGGQEEKILDIAPRERILLGRLRRYPCLYIESFSMRRLGDFFTGYLTALQEHDLDKCCFLIPSERSAFNTFVLKKYGLYPSPIINYVGAILQNVPDGKEAIETFFELLDEFLEANGYEKIDITSPTP